MLGVCKRIGEITGLDPDIIRIIFVIWFLNNPIALFWYFVFSLIV